MSNSFRAYERVHSSRISLGAASQSKRNLDDNHQWVEEPDGKRVIFHGKLINGSNFIATSEHDLSIRKIYVNGKYDPIWNSAQTECRQNMDILWKQAGF